MKTIGLLGGMSWVSSGEYYRLLNEQVSGRLGTYHSAKCVLYSVDFAEIEAMQVADRWADAGKALGQAAQRVQAAGADMVLICSNTMHKVADEVQAAVDVPVLHLADAPTVNPPLFASVLSWFVAQACATTINFVVMKWVLFRS